MLKGLKPAVIFEIAMHLLFWAFITLVPILSRPFPDSLHQFQPWNFIWINLSMAVQFYINAFLLIPVVLNKNRNIILYFVLLLCTFTGIALIMGIVSHPMPPFAIAHRPPPLIIGFNIFPLLAFTAAGFAYRYLADRFKMINNQRDIANATLMSELAFLRSQISPHFIFNVINSVVALSRLNPPAVEDTLIQLSKLMRHMLYITDKEKVTMKQKEEYLRSYIQLQTLRYQSLVRVSACFEISSPEKTIEPMLLIPFVENAFKHGTGNVIDPSIDITLKSDNKILAFNVQNIYNPDNKYEVANHGIGLNNVKRRLELLYPGRHKLQIDQTENTYKVNLQIHLK